MLLRVVPSKELRSLPFDIPYDARSVISDLRRLVYEHIAPANPGLTVFAVELSWRDKKLLSDHVQLGSIPFARGDSITARRFCDSFSLFSYVPGYSVDELALACTQTIPTVEQMLALDTRQAGMSAAERERLHVTHKRQQLGRHRSSDPPLPSQLTESAVSGSETAAGFDRLFSQLTPSNPDSGAMWDSLVRLPSSLTYLRRLLSLDGVSVESWVRLLDVNSVYRLTYSLQRIDDVLNARLPEELGRSFDNQQRLGWCEEFIKRGGLHNLINIATNAAFTSYSAQRHVSHALYYECLELLLRLITDFFSLDPAYPTSSSIAVDSGLQRGRITQHPAFDALCHKTVMEGVVPTTAAARATLQRRAAAGGGGRRGSSGSGCSDRLAERHLSSRYGTQRAAIDVGLPWLPSRPHSRSARPPIVQLSDDKYAAALARRSDAHAGSAHSLADSEAGGQSVADMQRAGGQLAARTAPLSPHTGQTNTVSLAVPTVPGCGG